MSRIVLRFHYIDYSFFDVFGRDWLDPRRRSCLPIKGCLGRVTGESGTEGFRIAAPLMFF